MRMAGPPRGSHSVKIPGNSARLACAYMDHLLRRAKLRWWSRFRASECNAAVTSPRKSTHNLRHSQHRCPAVHCPRGQGGAMRQHDCLSGRVVTVKEVFASVFMLAWVEMGVVGTMIRIILLGWLTAGLIALLGPVGVSAQEARPHSVLVLDQFDLRGPFYYQLWAALQGQLEGHADARVTIYGENLGLTRFGGAAYEESLKRHLMEKYRDRPIGAVVAIGKATLEHALRWRAELWPGVPIVFAMLDETDLARIGRAADGTGVLIRNSLANAGKAARSAVPKLDTIVLVGDACDRQVLFSHWNEELPAATSGLKVVDLVGQKMSDIRKGVAALPERSAIVYTAVFSDGEGTFYPPATALAIIAEKANRPIVVAAEPLLATGGIGGYALI